MKDVAVRLRMGFRSRGKHGFWKREFGSKEERSSQNWGSPPETESPVLEECVSRCWNGDLNCRSWDTYPTTAVVEPSIPTPGFLKEHTQPSPLFAITQRNQWPKQSLSLSLLFFILNNRIQSCLNSFMVLYRLYVDIDGPQLLGKCIRRWCPSRTAEDVMEDLTAYLCRKRIILPLRVWSLDHRSQ